MEKPFSLLSVQDAMVNGLTDYIIIVGATVSQRSHFLMAALNSPSGFFANVAEMVYVAEDLVRTVKS